MRLRIATFNVENLASRHQVGPRARPETAPALSLFDFAQDTARERAEQAVALTIEDEKRQLTALAIAETRADIVCLQEVDNLGVLQPFVANYVHEYADIRYGHLKLIDGNDPRGIDVAFMARRDLVAEKKGVKVRSYHEATYEELGVLSPDLEPFEIGPDDLVFNRDCLEVNLDLRDRQLTVFLLHLKSMGNGSEDGRDATRAIRVAEAQAVRRIVQDRFGEGWREANWIIAGDLNDYRVRILPTGVIEPATPSGIDCLFEDFAVDALAGVPPTERWTYFHRALLSDGSCTEEHVQLDYILLSPALAAANPEPHVEIIRRGLPYRVPLDAAHLDRTIGHLSTSADRYPRVGWSRPKASDHCPVVVEIDIPGP